MSFNIPSKTPILITIIKLFTETSPRTNCEKYTHDTQNTQKKSSTQMICTHWGLYL